MKDNTFNYSKALELLKEGKKVSCKRWGENGNVYVSLEEIDHKTKDSLKLLTLVLIDTTRDKAVTFTPSVENQIEDNWFEVFTGLQKLEQYGWTQRWYMDKNIISLLNNEYEGVFIRINKTTKKYEITTLYDVVFFPNAKLLLAIEQAIREL